MASKRVLTSALVPGMVVASDVVTNIGQVLLTKGSMLTDADITRLEFYSILSVYVDMTVSMPGTETALLYTSANSYLEQMKKKPQFQAFELSFVKNNRKFEGVLSDLIEENEQPDLDEMLVMVEEMVSGAKQIAGVFDMLHNLRKYDDALYAHSLNVALICSAFADWLGLSEKGKDTLVLSGLFHDLGKLKIDRELLEKKDISEKEFARIRNHTTEGYQLINQVNGVNDHIRNAVLMHHERLDGSGYPLGISGGQIDPYAKMVAIADVYEAMTAPRVYRPALCPFEAIRMFEEDGQSRFDPEFLPVFMENVLNTYLQNKVLLSNGEEGMLVMIHKNYLSRPLVRTESAVYDLRKRRDLEILEIR